MNHALSTLAAFLACGAVEAQAIDLAGAIYDGAGGPLLGGQVYHVTSHIAVPSGTTLTVHAGAVLKFVPANGLDVVGTLNVEGTTAEPVVFTSIFDDTAGGDSNQDGSATAPAPGDWEILTFFQSAAASVVEGAVVRYAGASILSDAFMLLNADIALRDCVIEDCLGSGIATGASHPLGPVIERCHVQRCDAPIRGVRLRYLERFADNTAADNSVANHIVLDPFAAPDEFAEDTLLTRSNLIGGVLVGDWRVMNGATLTVGPGVVFKSLYSYSNIYGSLSLLGTAAEPIALTSLYDDAYAGDTNLDGAATVPSPGDWTGLSIQVDGEYRLDHVIVRYAQNGIAAPDCEIFHLTNSVIELCQGIGLWESTGVATDFLFRDCVLRDNGSYAMSNVYLDALEHVSNIVVYGNRWNCVKSAPASVSAVIGPANLPGGALCLFNSTVSGNDMTLLPGTVVKLGPGDGLTVSSGVFNALGTPENPVVFTSVDDDEHGGDTAGDGGLTAPVPGAWENLELATNPFGGVLTGTFEHVLVRYGGDAQLFCRSPQVTLRSVRSEHSSGAGFQLHVHSGPAVGLVSTQNAGRGIHLSGPVVLEHVTVASNADAGIHATAGGATVSHSISWDNGGGNFVGLHGADVSFSDGGFAGVNGNLDVDPLFVDPSAGDFELSPGSPVVDAGDLSATPPGTDAFGDPRLLDGDLDALLAPDMGADELAFVHLTLAGTPAPGGMVTVELSGLAAPAALIAIAFAAGETIIPPLGTVLIDTSPLPVLLPAFVPSTLPIAVPPAIPTPLPVHVQAVSLFGAAGALSNAASVVIE